jgi:hypothetical protein
LTFNPPVPAGTGIKLLNCLWVRGAAIDSQRNSGSEKRALQQCGAEIHVLRSHDDVEGIRRLDSLARSSDRHIVLARLLPRELKGLRRVFRHRGNFSIVVDDWWSMPRWFMENATYVLFRNFNGLSVRLGWEPLAGTFQAPFISLPPAWNWYTAAALALRLPLIASAPLVSLFNRPVRRRQSADVRRWIYFPFPVAAEDVPEGEERLEFDFSNLGGTHGIWVIRDAFAPPGLAFANLYHDRKILADALRMLKGRPFNTYDWQWEGRFLRFEEYASHARRSRFTISTGGLHQTSVPKFLEFACLGTPMIGSLLPHEYPWLSRCLMPVAGGGLDEAGFRSAFSAAMDSYPALRKNCLELRPQLLRDYHLEKVLDVAQRQMDGLPIPPGYLTRTAMERLYPANTVGAQANSAA